MRLCDKFSEDEMKENLEKAWTMMLLLHCSLAALVVAIITIRFLVETLSENVVTPHLLNLYWGAGLSIVALTALRMAWRSEGRTACPSQFKMGWRFWTARITDFILLLSAILLPASVVSMTLWNGQDIEWLGHVLIVAGPKSRELRDLSLVFHEISAVFLALSLAGRLILVLVFAEQRRIRGRYR